MIYEPSEAFRIYQNKITGRFWLSYKNLRTPETPYLRSLLGWLSPMATSDELFWCVLDSIYLDNLIGRSIFIVELKDKEDIKNYPELFL